MQAFGVIAKQRIREAAARGDLDGVPGAGRRQIEAEYCGKPLRNA
jgi:hypothetical protein